jgi:hypothetical protein
MNCRMLVSAALAACFVCGQAAAQHLVEFRGADTRYRYVDWNYTFPNGVNIDAFYVGVPGSNEINAGGGYSFRIRKLTLTPLVYAVAGKENSQRGIKVALLVLYQSDNWKLNSFVAHFARISGGVKQYQVLDTLDVTRVFGKRFEGGLSTGFFHSGDSWNPQTGPMAKVSDRCGSWAVSYRFGPQSEFRLGRVFVF